MGLTDTFLIFLGKIVAVFSRLARFGAGETWPGHFTLKLRPSLLKTLEEQLSKGSVLITGTNGKTTTARLLRTILKEAGFRVVYNRSGANLLNGIASSLVLDAGIGGKARSEIGVFEVDEGNFPLALERFVPEVVVLLNLSRDQLDRYGEVDLTLERWEEGLARLPKTTHIVINSDDSYFSRLRENLSSHQFISLSTFSLHEPKGCPSPLPGDFNQLNTNAAAAAAGALGVDGKIVRGALAGFAPAFGRGEELRFRRRRVKILLAKNPASFNANLKLLSRQLAAARPSLPTVLLALNDNIPDGRDVSWIWDVDFEKHTAWLGRCEILISGKRAHDLALRLKYAGLEITNYKLQIANNLRRAIARALDGTSQGGTLYILPTYSAMLEARKIITGRSIGY